MRKSFLIYIFILITKIGFTQSAYNSINPLTEHMLERLEVKRGKLANSFHSNIKPFSRQQIGEFIAEIDTAMYLKLSKTDRKNLGYLETDNWEYLKNLAFDTLYSKKPIFKYILKYKNDFVEFNTDDFNIHVSPILNVSIGNNSAFGNLESKSTFINTRGVEIRGNVNNKLGFYSMMSDNQSSSPNFLVDFYKTYDGYPYQAFVKIKEDDTKNLQADYFSAIGYIAFKPIKSLTMVFGHDKNFIGSGIRSMIMSDFSAPFLQLKADLRLGRFQYQTIVGQLTNKQIFVGVASEEPYHKKFISFHHLNINVTKNLNLGLFESVMFAQRDSGLELNYINPVIFYRFVEGFLGSSDNAMVGADFKWNFLKAFSTYGQFVLDEYNVKEFKNEGWWAKKYSWQLGIKYFDVLKIKNLDFQAEINSARPYMYSHFSTYTNYVNYNLPIAHPLGANFKESIISVKYQPTSKLFLSMTMLNAIKGEDSDSLNYGGNIMLNNRRGRPSDYKNYIGQGFENHIKNTEFVASYMVLHNLFLDASFQRRRDSYFTGQKESLYSFGIRWNMANKLLLF